MKILTTFSLLLVLLPQFPTALHHAPLGGEVAFMRKMIDAVNPALLMEDAGCAVRLPMAIHSEAIRHGLDWRRLFALAWQESDFDCHAKNRRDKGGAYGPFQIRRLWEPLTGDPRHRYFDPDLAVARVVTVLNYYRATNRYAELVERRFQYPLLCLYNTGESRRVNKSYCRSVTRKMNSVEQEWSHYQRQSLVAWVGGKGRSNLVE